MIDKCIELRSDTFTQPTNEMLYAMSNAVVGDDVYEEDPTVNELQCLAAEKFDKEAGLFLVSGTMANVVAISTICEHGDQAIVDPRSHIYNLELGAISSICGVQPRHFYFENDVYNLDKLKREIVKPDIQRATTSLLCLENSYDLNQGLAISRDQIEPVLNIAKENGMTVYLDGARIFNTSIALNVPVNKLCDGIDALSFCLSKGLCCPVGAVLLGTEEFIQKARRYRQRLGGGWRQAGYLAAAGIIALNNMVERLSEDHDKAKKLAEAMFSLGLNLKINDVQTNIINLDVSPLKISAVEFGKKLLRKKIRVKIIDKNRVRMVTHKDVSHNDIDYVIKASKDLFTH
jgi:threonine aldolase